MLTFKNKEIKTLALAITQKCNLICDYCYSCARSLDMSNEVIKKSLASFVYSDGNHKKVVFLGGEPTLNIQSIRNSLHYINLLRKRFPQKKIETTINTNATILNKDILNLFQYIDCIAVSIDGMKKTHDAHRRYLNEEPSFDDVIKNIRKIKEKYSEKVVINKIITSETAHNLFQDTLFLYNLEPVSMYLSVALGDLGWNKKKVEKLFHNAKKLDSWISKHNSKKTKRIFKSLFENISQECVISHLAMDVTGNLYPCEILLNMKKDCIGNVMTGFIKQKDILTCKYSPSDKKCKKELCLNCNKICRKICFSNWKCQNNSQNGEFWLNKALEFQSFFIKSKKKFDEEDMLKSTLDI